MKTGKNFSANNVTGKRKESDFYETPYSITQQLLDVEDFPIDAFFYEPACGNGAIAKVLTNRGYEVMTTDIQQGYDFLKTLLHYRYIITNPPYSLAQEFILKAKEVCGEKFAFLLPLSYLHGKRRYDTIWLDKEFPLQTVHVFTRYPLLGEPLREDGKYPTGMMVYAWFVWNKNHTGAPTINWIDNNEYVLGSKDI